MFAAAVTKGKRMLQQNIRITIYSLLIHLCCEARVLLNDSNHNVSYSYYSAPRANTSMVTLRNTTNVGFVTDGASIPPPTTSLSTSAENVETGLTAWTETITNIIIMAFLGGVIVKYLKLNRVVREISTAAQDVIARRSRNNNSENITDIETIPLSPAVSSLNSHLTDSDDCSTCQQLQPDSVAFKAYNLTNHFSSQWSANVSDPHLISGVASAAPREGNYGYTHRSSESLSSEAFMLETLKISRKGNARICQTQPSDHIEDGKVEVCRDPQQSDNIPADTCHGYCQLASSTPTNDAYNHQNRDLYTHKTDISSPCGTNLRSMLDSSSLPILTSQKYPPRIDTCDCEETIYSNLSCCEMGNNHKPSIGGDQNSSNKLSKHNGTKFLTCHSLGNLKEKSSSTNSRKETSMSKLASL